MTMARCRARAVASGAQVIDALHDGPRGHVQANSANGRTSMLPKRAGGIFAAIGAPACDGLELSPPGEPF